MFQHRDISISHFHILSVCNCGIENVSESHPAYNSYKFTFTCATYLFKNCEIDIFFHIDCYLNNFKHIRNVK